MTKESDQISRIIEKLYLRGTRLRNYEKSDSNKDRINAISIENYNLTQLLEYHQKLLPLSGKNLLLVESEPIIKYTPLEWPVAKANIHFIGLANPTAKDIESTCQENNIDGAIIHLSHPYSFDDSVAVIRELLETTDIKIVLLESVMWDNRQTAVIKNLAESDRVKVIDKLSPHFMQYALSALSKMFTTSPENNK